MLQSIMLLLCFYYYSSIPLQSFIQLIMNHLNHILFNLKKITAGRNMYNNIQYHNFKSIIYWYQITIIFYIFNPYNCNTDVT